VRSQQRASSQATPRLSSTGEAELVNTKNPALGIKQLGNQSLLKTLRDGTCAF